jgi:hypothetical protein
LNSFFDAKTSSLLTDNEIIDKRKQVLIKLD